MSVNENRNCSCNMNSNDDMINSFSYNDSMNSNCNCCNCNQERVVDCGLRREMIENIRCLDFAITELALYLDTHPDDEKALCLHRKYCKEAKELKDKYQKVFGPLTINFPCNKWRWLEEPWPWERGNF